jgi:3-dehydroquinate synthase
MIDASVGGKTGVDTDAGKNLVGIFHPPAVVLADVDVLRTLSVAQRRSGLAEAIKHGVIADAAYFADVDSTIGAILAGDAEATLDAVARSVEIKAEVVKSDLRERGRRKTLNFGHTVGHAIEQATGYALLHGECVAVGMVIEARIAERLGIADRGTSDAIARVLAHAGLPTARPSSLDPVAVLAATRSDKKSRAGAVEYALPVRIGEMMDAGSTWSVPVDDAIVREMLA